MYFLDAKTIGEDLDLSGYEQLGEVVKYGFSTKEQAAERTKDADVIILNKVPINEETIGGAEHLKLVCVTATGTDNLDKDYLEKTRNCMEKCGRLFNRDSGTAHLCTFVLSDGTSSLL